MDSKADATSSPDLRASADIVASDDLSPAGASCVKGPPSVKVAEQDTEDRRDVGPAKPEPYRWRMGDRCRVAGCAKYTQNRCQGYCWRHYHKILKGEVEPAETETTDDTSCETAVGDSWTCHRCNKANPPAGRRCRRCMGWRGGKHPMKRSVKVSSAKHINHADKWTLKTPVSGVGNFHGDDAALALALQQQEREQYRRRRAATKVERFEPGGNPNVLDSGSSEVADMEAPVGTSSTKRKLGPSMKSEELQSPAAQSSTDGQVDQEAADAALAAQLAAMYANPALSSATEKVKFGGRRREAVKHFEPGGDPRETNPTEDYNLPPVPPSTMEGDENYPKRPKILTRKPGRVSKEEADRLMAAEEATQARLRDLMEGFDESQKNDDDDGEVNEGDQTVPIQMSMMDQLAKPRMIAVDGRATTVSVKCTPAVLDLTENEALETERQLKELYGVESEDAVPSTCIGCVLSLTYGPVMPDSDEENNTPMEQNGGGREQEIDSSDSMAAILSKVFESYLHDDGDAASPIASTGQSVVALADLTERFMDYHSTFPVGSLVDIVGVTKQLKMEPRRAFDILDVLCKLSRVASCLYWSCGIRCTTSIILFSQLFLFSWQSNIPTTT